jgi:dihydrofolate reductase
MRECVLYIACSLDGFIADPAGNIDWLLAFDATQSSYASFIENVDTLVMGHTTYTQLTTQLSPNVWPYPDKEVYVASRQEIASNEHAIFVNDAVKLVEDLKNKAGRTIWIVGGAKLIARLLDAGLIDTLIITVAPVSIGKGIPLFSDTPLNFSLVKSEVFGPFVESTYKVIGKK